MKRKKSLRKLHPKGEGELKSSKSPRRLAVETFGGKIQVEWDSESKVTPLGQLPFFIQFLKETQLYEPWVQECPLEYESNSASRKEDVLGTLFLSALAGHRRYAHITAMRNDGINPGLLGMEKVVSEDTARRAFQGCDEKESLEWMRKHLRISYEPLLFEPWILDIDSTVKPLYGHQEGAKVGYNPKKPGRPSHVYHTYFIGSLRLVLEVEVQSGEQTSSSFAQPRLWEFLKGLAVIARPWLIRGDCAWGTERMMGEAEKEGLRFLFKVKKTAKTKQLIRKMAASEEWVEAFGGWQGVESQLQLMGWSRCRRVVVLRRKLKGEIALQRMKEGGKQMEMMFVEPLGESEAYEYAVLVTNLTEEVETIAQLYRDRGDAENNFDEMKNQWGWGGYTTRDLKRCRIMALLVGLVYNWWSLFTRLVIPGRHAEAVTSRPLLLHAIARQVRHGREKTLIITSTHGKAEAIQEAFERFYLTLERFKLNAEQWSREEKWRWLLGWIFRDWLRGKALKMPRGLPAPA